MATAEKHTVRHQDGGLVEIQHYLPRKAIRAFCTECMGFEGSPMTCTSPNCPLYPYRGALIVTKSARRQAK